MSDPILAVRNLSKRFGKRLAVDDLSFEVARGEVFGFLGPNGAGKSTTIRMVTGLMRPLNGDAHVDGISVRRHRVRALRKVGALVETPAFYPFLTGWQNLVTFVSYGGRPDHAAIRHALDMVGLTGRERDRVKAYSHGMKQRLAIACALVPEPELLVLDEPTEGLDPRGMKEVRDLITRLANERGITVFLSSHLLSEVEQVCHRVTIIDKGRLVVEGSVRDLMAQEQVVSFGVDRPEEAERFLRDTLGHNVLGRDGDLIRLRAEHRATCEVNARLVEAGFAVHTIIPATQSLEDIFLTVTQKSVL